MISSTMTEELTQCIDAGKITATAAEKISKLSPGAYCMHRSWGFGRIAEWRLLTDQITIDFTGKKNHPMQLQYAAETLNFIPPNHILALIATDAAAVREKAKKDPVALIRSILMDHEGAATADEISKLLVPSIFDMAGFKKWFDATKKKLKADGHFVVPAKKGAPLELQEEKVEPYRRLLEQFRSARHPKEQVTALDAALKLLQSIPLELEELRMLAQEVQGAAERGGRIHATKAIELVLARDEIAKLNEALMPLEEQVSLASLLATSSKKLAEIFAELPSSKYRRVLEAFPSAFSDRWQESTQQLLRYAEPRLINEIFNLFENQEQHEAFKALAARAIQERSATSDFLKWICSERTNIFPEFINHELFAAILSALERDMHAEAKRGARFRESLFEDRELIADLLKNADIDDARNTVRKIMISPVFGDLDRRSILARVLKVHPDLQSMITGDQDKEISSREESLVVSWASLERRKKEHENLVTKLIPQNTRDIAVARSYGDLRENVEFKSAKEQQSVLLRQKSELEQMLNHARGTNFENPDASVVSIGTVVSLKDQASKEKESFSILGAWDGAPEKHWVSYQAAIGQALLGHKVGDIVTLPAEKGNRSMKIEKIMPFTDKM
ncbi:MAG: hypothetical protein A3F67_05665 [Verrucomicrobia bacterium RIFCSPHIGHO2_12_FULL_41_10]|nr:MAG: hypothetical protein A3F67_05665 [Verrucomicrobia bacterium RIFCSPHIGHO2_12_FULL_41_10]